MSREVELLREKARFFNKHNNSLSCARKFNIHIYVTCHELCHESHDKFTENKVAQLSTLPAYPSTLAHFNHSQKINKYKYVTICQHYCTADRWASPRGKLCIKRLWLVQSNTGGGQKPSRSTHTWHFLPHTGLFCSSITTQNSITPIMWSKLLHDITPFLVIMSLHCNDIL